jgi:hypothetical protein
MRILLFPKQVELPPEPLKTKILSMPPLNA